MEIVREEHDGLHWCILNMLNSTIDFIIINLLIAIKIKRKILLIKSNKLYYYSINNIVDQISVHPTIMRINFYTIVMKNSNEYDEYQVRQSAKNSV